MTTPETNTNDDYQPRDFETVLDGTTVLIRCDYRLEQQAEWLLKTLADIHKHDPLQEGATIELGWSVLTLVDEDGKLVVCEPDFAESPFENAIADVTMTLHILAEQNYIISQTHTSETAQIPRFDDTIVMQKGVLDETDIYLERDEASDDEDSGWFIGSLGNDDEDETKELDAENLEAIYVYELLKTRPALLSVLGLPAGYVVVFTGDDIDSIVDENDNDVWNVEHTNGVA